MLMISLRLSFARWPKTRPALRFKLTETQTKALTALIALIR